MTSKAIKAMRKKQFVFINAISLSFLLVYMVAVNYSGVNLSHLLFILGAYYVMESVYFFIKKDSVKSLIPIIEQVKKYEKEKMGKEWSRQNKTSHVLNFFLGVFLMFQSYWFQDLAAERSVDIGFFLVFIIIIMVAVNIILLLHSYRIDRSNNPDDLKGYTWKSTLIGFVGGLLLAGIFLAVIVFYVLSTM